MRLLLLSQYFPPEVGAPQNRLYELALRLQQKGVEVTVLTTMPHYPDMEIKPEYRGKLYHFEEMHGLKVHRAFIYVSEKRTIFFRLLNYFSFVFTAFFVGLFKTGKQDVIFCESPPLFLGITAWLLKVFKKARMIFNVSDLWPESAERLGLVTSRLFLNLATSLEEFCYIKAELITGQTMGIVKNIQSRFPEKTVYWLPNGVDTSYFNPDTYNGSGWRGKHGFSAEDKIFLYAGILGHAQGLEVILKAAAKLKDQAQIKFVFVGNGPEKRKLLALMKEMNLPNVHFLPTVPKTEMPEVIAGANASIVPLKKLELFKGAIPSKIFENLAMQKPIILGVDGEARKLFIEEGKAGLYFTPEDEYELSERIKELSNSIELEKELGVNALKYVRQKFNRDVIANDFWKLLQKHFKQN